MSLLSIVILILGGTSLLFMLLSNISMKFYFNEKCHSDILSLAAAIAASISLMLMIVNFVLTGVFNFWLFFSLLLAFVSSFRSGILAALYYKQVLFEQYKWYRNWSVSFYLFIIISYLLI